MKRNWYVVIFTLILFLGFTLRFYHFSDHYLFGNDVSRDLLVARGAISVKEIPMVGSFSSAGPFVFGPNWYWFLMLPTYFFPGIYFAPWLVMELISLSFIAVMGAIGFFVRNKRFSLLLALITALSPIAVDLGSYLTQHALVEIFSGLTLLSFVAYVKTKSRKYSFLCGLCIGAAMSLHYQAINMLIYLPLILLVKRQTLKEYFLLVISMGLGFLVFLLPLLVWDYGRGFKNLAEIFYYFRVGQYRFWVSNRWLIYLGQFWPTYMSKVFGQQYLVGIILFFGGIISVIFSLFSVLKSRKYTVWILIAFIAQLFALRYFRGEKFDGYLVYLHPVVLFISGWLIYQLLNKFKLLYIVFVVLTFLTINQNMNILLYKNGADRVETASKELSSKYSNEKFQVFAQGIPSGNCASSLTVMLDNSGLDSENGRPIGVCMSGDLQCSHQQTKHITKFDFQNTSCSVVDLSMIPKNELTKQKDWYSFSKFGVYDDVQNWWKK